MREVYLVDGIRTPIGKTKGILKDFLPEQLAAAVLNALLHRSSLAPETVDTVFLGNAVGPGGNLARVSVLEAGWPYSIPAVTIDAQCGSGLAAINLAQAAVASGQAELVIAGGLESTSLAPKRCFNEADPRFVGQEKYYEQAPFAPEWVGNPEVGQAAENLARCFGISRQQMDELALSSHQKASQAIAKGLLEAVIQPLEKAGCTLAQDEGPKANMSSKLLARLPGAFVPGGSITAGNACLKHDGAAALMLASQAAVAKYALPVQAKLYQGVSVGYDPNFFALSPVPAIKKLLRVNGLSMSAIGAMEINEAFAVKILACCQQLNIPIGLVNQLGGALAFGHPYGASGAIIILHLLQTLIMKKEKFGLAAIGAVGGIGTATLLEVVEQC